MTPRTVLVTRPAPDGAAFAERIRERGHRAVVEPLLEISFLDDAVLDLEGVAALAFTSANGVRAAVHAAGDGAKMLFDLPAFCVGRATARVAREAGFSNLVTAAGDVDDLAREIGAARPPGAVLHVAGRERAGDLVGALSAGGIDARRVVLYGAEARDVFSDETRAALAEGGIDAVAIFSPRTARQFVTLIKKAGLEEAVKDMRLLALSPRVAAAADLDFAEVFVADRPDQDALLDLIGRAPARDGAMAETDKPWADKPKGPKEAEEARPADAASDAGPGQDAPPIPPRLTERRSRGGRGGAFVLGVLLAFALMAAAAALVLFEPNTHARVQALLGSADKDAGAAVTARLSALEDRLTQLQGRLESLPRPVDSQRLDELERAIKSLPVGADAEKLDAIEQRIGDLASRLERSGATARPAMMVLVAFDRRLESGRPFAALYDRARTALGADHAVLFDAVAPYRDSGVPTARALADAARALALAPPAPKAETSDGANDAGLWARIKDRLRSMVRVRRVDDAGDGAPGADALRDGAAGALARGDADAALAALEKIDADALAPASAEALNKLRADVRARVAANRLTAAIGAALAEAP